MYEHTTGDMMITITMEEFKSMCYSHMHEDIDVDIVVESVIVKRA
mgnify:CR=1 FL=1